MNHAKIQDYSDIIDLPHHQSEYHPHMSISDRAAQFMPFAALTGYDDAVKEVGRITECKHQLDEDAKEEINRQLMYLLTHIQEHPTIKITFFVKDNLKEGGAYITKEDVVNKIDAVKKRLIMSDAEIIRFDDIQKIILK